MIGVHQRRAGNPGNPGGKLKAEKLTLAVDNVRLPVNDFLNQLIPVGGRHPQVGIHCPQRDALDVIHMPLLVGVDGAGNGENAHIVTLLGQLVKKILDACDHAVGIGGIQIRSN